MTKHDLTTWRLLGIQQALDEPDSQLRQRACRQLGVEGGELRGFRIARRSLDARKGRHALHFNCHVDLLLPAGRKPALARARVGVAGSSKRIPREIPFSIRITALRASARKCCSAALGERNPKCVPISMRVGG